MIRDNLISLLLRTHGREVDNDTLMQVLGPKLRDPVTIKVRRIQ